MMMAPAEYPARPQVSAHFHAPLGLETSLAPRVGPLRRVDWPAGRPLPQPGAWFSAPPIDARGLPLAGEAERQQKVREGGEDEQQQRTQQQTQQRLFDSQHHKPAMSPLGEQHGLPDVHASYACGPRQYVWNTRVPVPEENHGIMINAEFVPRPDQLRHQVVFYDDAIRNSTWRHVGALIPPGRCREELAVSELHAHADYGEAVDLKGLLQQELPPHATPAQRAEAHYTALVQYRAKAGLVEETKEVVFQASKEVLDETGIKEFFSDPNRVAYERIAK
mmetsp:Transcript_70369/g.153378  ORF Transcript_70369/g.153378 Transcript_70369/m.153378 type:complete len:278 (+) Transcript_70369:320-1153(+)